MACFSQNRAQAGFTLEISIAGGAYNPVTGYPTSGNGTVTYDGMTFTLTTINLPVFSCYDLGVTGTPSIGTTSSPVDICIEAVWTGGPSTIRGVNYGFSESASTPGTIEDSINGTNVTGNLAVSSGNPKNGYVSTVASAGYTFDTVISFDSTGAAISFDSNNTVLPTPVPGGFALMLSGLPILGVLRTLRSRNRPEVTASTTFELCESPLPMAT
jgi:hypothetical protein